MCEGWIELNVNSVECNYNLNTLSDDKAITSDSKIYRQDIWWCMSFVQQQSWKWNASLASLRVWDRAFPCLLPNQNKSLFLG